jgi:hypothetical protein
MSTLRQLVSNVRSMHRILSTDSMITDRAIASELRRVSLLMIKREKVIRKKQGSIGMIGTNIVCLSQKIAETICGNQIHLRCGTIVKVVN